MKVSEAMKLLSEMHPDEDVIMVLWGRADADDLLDEELQLSPEMWSRIVAEAEETDALGDDIHDWVTASVLEYAEFQEVTPC